MKNKIINYSLEHIQGSRFQLEIIEGDRVTSYFGELVECQKALSEDSEVRFKKMRQTLFEPVKNLSSELEEIIEIKEQAKSMHKEECAEVFKAAQECAVKHDGVYFKYNSIEDYYKSKETELESLPCELESLSNIKQHEVTWIAALDYAIEKMKGLNNAESIDAFKQYYNQTYGGNNE